MHPRFTEEGIEHLRERGRYYDPNDVVEREPEPDPTPVPTPAPTAAPTPAPSTRVSASNLDEATAGGLLIGNDGLARNFQSANAFTTGPNSGGYTLTSVSALFGAQTGSTQGDISVAVHADSSGNPADTALVTLTGSNPATAGTYAYTCSGNGCALSANTTYFLVISAPNASGAVHDYEWRYTNSSNQTAVPSGNGWLIANDLKAKQDTNDWTDTTGSAGIFKVEATTR